MRDKTKEFLVKLKNLLSEYDASIDAYTYDYGESMGLGFEIDREDIDIHEGSATGLSIVPEDIEDYLNK